MPGRPAWPARLPERPSPASLTARGWSSWPPYRRIAVASALAEALGISVSECTTAAAVEQVVCAQLKSRRTLLLLDNCEHLVGTVARIVHLLLRSCPGVTVLATAGSGSACQAR